MPASARLVVNRSITLANWKLTYKKKKVSNFTETATSSCKLAFFYAELLSLQTRQQTARSGQADAHFFSPVTRHPFEELYLKWNI